MIDKKYYDVAESCYLFSRQKSPEESIRQWVIFELLSTYGVKIGNVQIETPVKVGSKTYRADVVIYQDQKPYVLIECKEPSFSKIDDALRQAISYSNFLGTEYVVATNGNFWVVKRKIQTDWYTISDIPINVDIEPKELINDWLWFFEDVKPLIFWIYRQVPRKFAHRYFDKMQWFFAGKAKLGKSDAELLAGVDFLLRIVAGSNQVEDIKTELGEYHSVTFRAAFARFYSYFNQIGYKPSFDKSEFVGLMGVRELLHPLVRDFENFIIQNSKTENDDLRLARLIVSVLQYFRTVLSPSGYKNIQFEEIPPGVVNEFCNYLAPILASRLGLTFPSSLDVNEIENLKIITCNEWLDENGVMP